MKKVKTAVAVAMAAVMLSVVGVSVCAADASQQSVESIGLVCAANKGDFSAYPECSLEAFKSAFDIGCKVVCTNIRFTKDGVAVAVEDETADRTLLTDKGESVSGNIADFTLAELQQMKLKSEAGEYKVPTLDDILAATPDGCRVMVKNAWSVKEKLAAVSKEKLIYLMDAKPKDIELWASENSQNLPQVCCNYNGSILFTALSRASFVEKNDYAAMVRFTSKNVNSIVFSEFLGGKINKKGVVTVADVTDYTLCGGRIDDSVGYDELVTAGYDVIITNNAKDFCDYIEDVEAARLSLGKTVEEADAKYKNDNCTKDSKKKLRWAIEASDEAVSLSQIHLAQNDIKDAMARLVYIKQNGTFSTPIRVAIVVVVGGIFAAADIILYRKPKKSRSVDNIKK